MNENGEIFLDNELIGRWESMKYELDMGEFLPNFPKIIEKLSGFTDSIRPVQYLIFKVLEGKLTNNPIFQKAHFVINAPTGSGKSLAFLIILLNSIFKKIEKNRKKPKSLIFTSSMNAAETVFKQLQNLVSGSEVRIGIMIKGKRLNCQNFDIGIFTYGSFYDEYEKYGDFSYFSELNYLVVDEADCVLPDVESTDLVEKLFQASNCRVMFCSATPSSYFDIFFESEKRHKISIFVGSLAVSKNVKQEILKVDSGTLSKVRGFRSNDVTFYGDKCDFPLHPFDQLYKILKNLYNEEKKPKVIVFLKKRTMCNNIAARLLFSGFKAGAIHSNMNVKIQQQIMEKFSEGKYDILVAGMLLARGFDGDIDVVINYDLPKTYSDYVHRCGRTGRNGRKGLAYTFIDSRNPDDYNPAVVDSILKEIQKLK